MNAKTIKLVIAIVLLLVAAVLLFRFVAGGSSAVGPDGQPTNEIGATVDPNPPPAE